MTPASQIDLQPIIRFANELWHAVSRPAVSTQILIIFVALFFCLLLEFKAKIDFKSLKIPIKRRAVATLMALVVLSVVYGLMEILNRPNGLIQQVCSLLLTYIALSVSLQLLIHIAGKGKAGQIIKYKRRLFMPAFIGYVFFKLIQIFGDPKSLFGAPIIQLFGTPFNLGDALLLTVGLYLWINFSSLATQILQWLFGSEKIESR